MILKNCHDDIIFRENHPGSNIIIYLNYKISRLVITIRLLPISALVMLSSSLFSQTVQRDPEMHTITNLGDAMIQKGSKDVTLQEPGSNLGGDSINYDKILGSPFWPEKYKKAKLFSGTKYITSASVKINLVTSELYFLQDSLELILNDEAINRFMFVDDNTVFMRNFPGLFLNRKPIKDFIQVMNEGNYQLLKYTKRRINTPESASKLERKYSFIDLSTYFLLANGKTENMRRLNRETVFLLIPSALRDEEWIDKNSLNLKNEKDVISFLNYINTLAK